MHYEISRLSYIRKIMSKNLILKLKQPVRIPVSAPCEAEWPNELDERQTAVEFGILPAISGKSI